MPLVNEVEAEYRKVGKLAREIAVKRVTIMAGIATAVNVLLVEHVVSVNASHAVTTYVGIAFNALTALVGALWSRDGTTPADPALDPKSNAGEDLAPVAGTGPHVATHAATSAPVIAAPAPIGDPVSTLPPLALPLVDAATTALDAARAISPPNTTS